MDPATLPRHELAGLRVRVVEATDPTLVGIEGTVHDETQGTLLVSGASGTKQVPKAVATFEFAVPTDDGTEYVTVEGTRLLARPARRTEQTGDSTWR